MQKRSSTYLDRVNQDFNRAHPALKLLLERQTAIVGRYETPKASTPAHEFLRDVAWLTLFMTMTAVGTVLAGQGILLALLGLPLGAVGILGTIGRLRRLVVGHVHEATHGVVTSFYRSLGVPRHKAHRITEFILDAGSLISFSRNGQDYRRAHARHHRPDMLGTVRDPDGAELYDWGIWPSLTDDLYGSLWRRILDPRWHARFFWERIKSNILTGRPYRRLLGAATFAALLGSGFLLPLPIWFTTIVLPWIPGFHIASLLQVITEHPYGHDGPARTLDEHAARTWERVPYAPAPNKGPREAPIAWLRWAGANLIHLAERLAILDDTMIAHGYHHLAWPLGRPFTDWWNTVPRFLEAHRNGLLPEGADGRIVRGVGGALRCQQIFFRSMAGER